MFGRNSLIQKFLPKEPVNSLTHFTAFSASLVGLVFLIVLSKNSVPKLVTMTIYGVSLVLLYGASSVYHWIKTTPRKNMILKKLDHIAIYLLVAGSYTPVFFYGLKGAWKWAMLLAIWILALIGLLTKALFNRIPRSVSTVIYLALGWIALVPFAQLIKTLPGTAIALMLIGGIAYTIGAIIYGTKSFNFFPGRFGFHEIFHIFVVAGSSVHFAMMVKYFMPM